ncbi:sarcosine oxidase subunit gamma family protein [Nguyenibacter sp. L1]|uniref:sarcosine oxidase subunit gamma n=1 Tax=Nguyenibacter sp. L1 TaxID=3049350 RepID=UPI002B4844A8|nr:sarcosine oxidase subunit gamma family protein [Nguyenibacter sp. L1]WRH86705.1 sarcosine oxidase subunit gamma family protein [Nguyenibacter sp. L1]
MARSMAEATIAPDTVLVREPRSPRYVLQGRAPALQAAARALGLKDVPAMLRAATGTGGTALRLGPFELLVLPGADDPAALQDALGPIPHSLVGVSDRNVTLTLQGPWAARILSGLCPLDFMERVFPVGMATRAPLEKADAVFWRTAPDCFHLEVWRSFGLYAEDAIREVARGVTFASLAI